MLKDIKAVIFDLDGTLVDSMWLWKEIDVAYLAKFGYELPDDYQSIIEGMSFRETAAYTKERFQIPDSVEKMMDDFNSMAWDYYMHKVSLKKGVIDFLGYCKKHRIKMGIATSNSHELVDSLAERLGLNEYLSCIITACDVNKGKPAPDVYLKASDTLGVEPKKCLVFEDVSAGIMAGKNAGMKVCAIADDYSINQIDRKKELADYYIEDYTEILNA